MHFGYVKHVEQHGSTRSTRRTWRVVSRRDVTSQVEFGLIQIYQRCQPMSSGCLPNTRAPARLVDFATAQPNFRGLM